MVVRFVFAVTGQAVGCAGRQMIKCSLTPIGSVVTLRTLAGKVVCGLILVVAALAVCSAYRLMIEGCLSPV
jgi:hypothetical protein